jgi:hypothetical protein
MSVVSAKMRSTSLSVKICEPLNAQEVWARKKEVAQCEFADFDDEIEKEQIDGRRFRYPGYNIRDFGGIEESFNSLHGGL